MIRYTNSLLISVVIHGIAIILIVLVWQYYTSSKKTHQDKKIYLKLSDVVTSQKNEQIQPQIKTITQQVQEKKIEKLQEPKKITQVESKSKIIEKPKEIEKAKKIEKIKEVKKQKEIKKIEKPKEKLKTVKKYNLEPKKIFDFAIEEVPTELTFLNKRPTKKRILQEPREPKIVQKKVVKKVVKPKTVQKSIEKKILKPKVVQKKINKKPQQSESSKNYLQVNTKEISKLLKDNLYYPRSARKRNITGQVLVKFKLGSDSKVYDIKVLKSSSEVLGRAAMKTIMDLSSKFPKPQKGLILHVPIEYKLN